MCYRSASSTRTPFAGDGEPTTFHAIRSAIYPDHLQASDPLYPETTIHPTITRHCKVQHIPGRPHLQGRRLTPLQRGIQFVLDLAGRTKQTRDSPRHARELDAFVPAVSPRSGFVCAGNTMSARRAEEVTRVYLPRYWRYPSHRSRLSPRRRTAPQSPESMAKGW